jgi:hypothetical protein
MRRNCDWCGKVYTAHRAASRFCGDTCRKRNLRAPKTNGQANGKTAASASPVNGSLAETIRAELAALGLDETTPAHLALDLAQRIDAPNTSDSSRAPMAREVMRLREQLLHTAAPDPNDPVHILQQRVRAQRNNDDEALASWQSRWDALPPSIRNPNVEAW